MCDDFFMDFSFFVHRFFQENLRNFFSQMRNALWVYGTGQHRRKNIFGQNIASFPECWDQSEATVSKSKFHVQQIGSVKKQLSDCIYNLAIRGRSRMGPRSICCCHFSVFAPFGLIFGYCGQMGASLIFWSYRLSNPMEPPQKGQKLPFFGLKQQTGYFSIWSYV